jgi:hypothetical protein
MNIAQGLVEHILDLIKINNDRCNFYQSVTRDAKEYKIEIIELYRDNASISARNAEDLSFYLTSSGMRYYEAKAGVLFNGLQTAYSRNDTRVFARDCLSGDYIVLEAYKALLVSELLVDWEARKILMDHKYTLQASIDKLLKYQDLHEQVNSEEAVSIWNRNLQNIKAG